jgi:chemotaxis protein methyltransferase CheR
MVGKITTMETKTMQSKEFSESTYRDFCTYLEDHCGIVLGGSKQYLVRSRLFPLIEEYQLPDLTTVINLTITGRNRELQKKVIDAMTTNETLWFRDGYPYELLHNSLLTKLDKLNKPIRIWSAACSSGQEPYSIAICYLEYKQRNPGAFSRGFEIVATDLSSEMLAACRDGSYDDHALARGMGKERLAKFFHVNGTGRHQVNEEVKRLVKFQSVNLLHAYHALGKFDMVFIRNVLIYFSTDVKTKILQQIAGLMSSDSILFLGASESVSYTDNLFSMVKASPGLYYQLPK